jgi:hypothetical protein
LSELGRKNLDGVLYITAYNQSSHVAGRSKSRVLRAVTGHAVSPGQCSSAQAAEELGSGCRVLSPALPRVQECSRSRHGAVRREGLDALKSRCGCSERTAEISRVRAKCRDRRARTSRAAVADQGDGAPAESGSGKQDPTCVPGRTLHSGTSKVSEGAIGPETDSLLTKPGCSAWTSSTRCASGPGRPSWTGLPLRPGRAGLALRAGRPGLALRAGRPGCT